LLKTRIWADLVGLDEETARRRLIAAVGSNRMKPARPPRFPPNENRPEYPGATTPNRITTTSLEPSDDGGISQAVRSPALKLASAGIFEKAHTWLCEDQLANGAWGAGCGRVLGRVSGTPLSDFDNNEGGIISTHLALRALRAYERDDDLFHSRNYARQALQYFERRSDPSGAYGRNVMSWSGIELHTSVRHTAMAAGSLLDLDGPPESISRSIKYLQKMIRTDFWTSEAAPSFAISSILSLNDRLSKGDVTRGPASVFSTDREQRLHDILRDLCSRGKHAPLWPPYGRHDPMASDTALVTIEMLPLPTPSDLRSPIVRALLKVADLEDSETGGLQYGPDIKVPDIGMSSVMLSVLTRRAIPERFGSPIIQGQLQALSERLTDFLIDNWMRESAWTYTHADTFSNLLLLLDLVRSDPT